MPRYFVDADGNYFEATNDRPARDGERAVAKRNPTEPTVSVEQIKTEAMRRILALCPEWKQRNLLAQATILAKKGAANWTTEEQAAWDAGEALWTQIAAIRAKSDAIEAMDPRPSNVRDDALWEA